MRMPLLFLHGWGQSRQVWEKQRAAFPDATFLNLPGHGGAENASAWLESMAAQLPDAPSIIIGWSLGGIIAMQLAVEYPEKVAAAALVSTTPSFCSKQGWGHGCSDELFQAFRNGIETNSAKTMNRFFALMFQGDLISRQQFNEIARIAVDRNNPPSEEGLKQGLEMLEQCDLRHQLKQITQPTLVMHGEQDGVIPVSAGRHLAENMANSTLLSFDDCGHAPFLSHSEIFNRALEAWCHKI